MSTVIHPSAHISSKARLGNNVVIGPGVVVEDEVTIGDDVVIGPYAVLMNYTSVGSKSRIHAHAVLGDWPQDIAFKNHPSFLTIGEACLIREGVTLHRGTKPETTTVVGDRCFLMANSHVAHNCHLGSEVIMANGALLGGYVDVGDRAFLSGNVVVHQFCRIGALAMLSGGGAFSKDVPHFCTTLGADRNTIVGLNVVGMRRAGMDPAARLEVRRAFKILYCSGLNVHQAIERISNEFESAPVREFCGFIQNSKRGICAYVNTNNAADINKNAESASESETLS